MCFQTSNTVALLSSIGSCVLEWHVLISALEHILLENKQILKLQAAFWKTEDRTGAINTLPGSLISHFHTLVDF